MKTILLKLFVLFFFFAFAVPIAAQGEEMPKEEFSQATVVSVVEEGKQNIADVMRPFQRVKIRFLNGTRQGGEELIDHGLLYTIDESHLVKAGEKVVVLATQTSDGKTLYQINEVYRLPQIGWIAGFFV